MDSSASFTTVASIATMVTECSDTDYSDSDTVCVDLSGANAHSTLSITQSQQQQQQAASFYIGDLENSQQSQQSSIASPVTLAGNRIALGHQSPSHVTLLMGANNNNNNIENVTNDHHNDDNTDEDFEHMARLMSASTEKLSAKNSFDSGYGLIINGPAKQTRFHSGFNNSSDSLDNDSGLGVGDSLSNSYRQLKNGSVSSNGNNNNYLSPRAILIVLAQVAMAIVFSAGGNFGAGLILDKNQKWEVFGRVPELFYLVPTLLGLKGNLEMTMVARLSTMANMGKMNSWSKICWAALTNLATVQCQATIISVLASIVTFVIAALAGNPSVDHAGLAWVEQGVNGPLDTTASAPVKVLVIFATSLCTANVACFASSILMILLIVLFSNLNLNPDNFATAIAASFGDIVTSWLLCDIGQYIFTQTVWTPESFSLFGKVSEAVSVAFYQDLRSPTLALVIIVVAIALLPLWVYYACRSHSTRAVLLGIGAWAPILVAMCISFVSGFFLRYGASMFAFMALFQPLINGVGGNLAAITTSRMSTELHQARSRGELEASMAPKIPQKSFAQSLRYSLRSLVKAKDPNNIFMVVFLLISLAVQVGYGYLLPVVNQYGDRVTVTFYLMYAAASTAQVFVLLLLTRVLVHRLWDMDLDPDTCAIPILTAIGDLLGTVFLLAILMMLKSMADPSAFAAIADTDAPNSPIHAIGVSTTETVSTLIGQAAQFVTYRSV